MREIAKCCIPYAGEAVVVDPHLGKLHTIKCTKQEIQFLRENSELDDTHPSGITFRDRIAELSEAIGVAETVGYDSTRYDIVIENGEHNTYILGVSETSLVSIIKLLDNMKVHYYHRLSNWRDNIERRREAEKDRV